MGEGFVKGLLDSLWDILATPCSQLEKGSFVEEHPGLQSITLTSPFSPHLLLTELLINQTQKQGRRQGRVLMLSKQVSFLLIW